MAPTKDYSKPTRFLYAGYTDEQEREFLAKREALQQEHDRAVEKMIEDINRVNVLKAELREMDEMISS